MNKAIKIIFRILAVLLVIAGLCYGAYWLWLDPHRASLIAFETSLPMGTKLTRDEAREDLMYLVDHMEQYHPAWIDGSDVSVVEAQLDAELNGLGDMVCVDDLWRAAAYVAAVLHDGHTAVGYSPETKLYIDSFELLHAYEVAAINGVPADELYEAFLSMCSYELESYARYEFENAIVQKAYLSLMGFDTDAGITFTYMAEEGPLTVHHTFVPLDAVAGYEGDTGETEFVTYSIDEQAGLGILTLDECNYNAHYLQVLNAFFGEVADKNIGHIAVDLRGNGGGNSNVIRAFLQYADVDRYLVYGGVDVRMGPFLWKNNPTAHINQKKENAFDGDIYVLTSTGTFSAAADFAVTVHDNGIGTIVGGIPGNMPSSYGDILRFQMPHSKLVFSVSYKYFHRADKTLDAEPLIPDYETDAADAMDMLYEVIGE